MANVKASKKKAAEKKPAVRKSAPKKKAAEKEIDESGSATIHSIDGETIPCAKNEIE